MFDKFIMKFKKILSVALLLICIFPCMAQQMEDKWSFEKKHTIGSQAFVLFANFTFDPSPEYYELNYGYRFSTKDEISKLTSNHVFPWFPD